MGLATSPVTQHSKYRPHSHCQNSRRILYRWSINTYLSSHLYRHSTNRPTSSSTTLDYQICGHESSSGNFWRTRTSTWQSPFTTSSGVVCQWTTVLCITILPNSTLTNCRFVTTSIYYGRFSRTTRSSTTTMVVYGTQRRDTINISSSLWSTSCGSFQDPSTTSLTVYCSLARGMLAKQCKDNHYDKYYQTTTLGCGWILECQTTLPLLRCILIIQTVYEH